MATIEESPTVVPRWPWVALRITGTISAVLVFDQAVFAGQFLAGGYDSLRTHRDNATYAGIAVLVAALAGLLVWRPGRGPVRGPLWPLLGWLAVFGLVALQIAIGFSRLIVVHVPLGVATIGLATALAARAWRR